MINQSNKTLNTNITKLVNQPYKYGFSTTIEKDIIEKGLNEDVVRLISQKKQEPEFLLKFRFLAKNWAWPPCLHHNVMGFRILDLGSDPLCLIRLRVIRNLLLRARQFS